MTKKEIKSIKKDKGWSFTIWDIFERYFFVIFPLGLILVSFSVTASGFTNNLNNLKIGGFICLCFSFYALILITKRLYENQIFKSHKINNLTLEKIEQAVINSGFNNFKYYELGYFEVISNVSWFSWGERIIIIKNEDEILINSRPTNQPLTFGIDKKNNIRKIVNQLNQMKSL